MVSFSTTGLLLPVALFPLGTTHDCAIGQAGPSIWSRLPPAIPTEVLHAADRTRGRSDVQPSFAAGRTCGGDSEALAYRSARAWSTARVWQRCPFSRVTRAAGRASPTRVRRDTELCLRPALRSSRGRGNAERGEGSDRAECRHRHSWL